MKEASCGSSHGRQSRCSDLRSSYQGPARGRARVPSRRPSWCQPGPTLPPQLAGNRLGDGGLTGASGRMTRSGRQLTANWLDSVRAPRRIRGLPMEKAGVPAGGTGLLKEVQRDLQRQLPRPGTPFRLTGQSCSLLVVGAGQRFTGVVVNDEGRAARAIERPELRSKAAPRGARRPRLDELGPTERALLCHRRQLTPSGARGP